MDELETLNDWHDKLPRTINPDAEGWPMSSTKTPQCDKCGSFEPWVWGAREERWIVRPWKKWHFTGECLKREEPTYQVKLRVRGRDGYREESVTLVEALTALGVYVPTLIQACTEAKEVK